MNTIASSPLIRIFITCSLLFSNAAIADTDNRTGANFVSTFGYTNVIELSNQSTRVLLLPQVGGKVLQYSYHGKDSLVVDAKDKGWHFDGSNQSTTFNSGGRFDIGSPAFLPDRRNLLLGHWHGEIIGDRQARLTSVKDPETGLQIIRTFTLDSKSSRLRIDMRMTNYLKREVTAHFWTRTFAKGGGKFVIPMTEGNIYPKGYTVFDVKQKSILLHPPADPHVHHQDGYFQITGQPQHQKFGIETYTDWAAYFIPNDLVMLRQFQTFPDRAYTDLKSGTFSIYYNTSFKNHSVAEIEPMGPRERLKQGQSAYFTEVWTLAEYPFEQLSTPISSAQIIPIEEQLKPILDR
ncbi:hypothetical protein [Echinimonas agarilytica]|uniref:Aldose 1-epimerase n=1 Tax=Echinimonas agarilytica TaxID=1215918 RepID=A0AA42B6H7_9GAMM|nr:hypothetical protein [Echinimonas agarilytica]MCM2678548.1 hypothetical protein [Echinimonas agarilytica]